VTPRRALIDENMPHKLRQALSTFDTVSVRYMGWAGLKNGDLLAAAESAGLDVFVTGDKTVQFGAAAYRAIAADEAPSLVP
jgi:hypothetical protein